MKPEWSESCESIVGLHELDECVAHFDTFLEYLYTGIVSLTYSTVLPLLALADKYNVQVRIYYISTIASYIFE